MEGIGISVGVGGSLHGTGAIVRWDNTSFSHRHRARTVA